VFDVAVISLPDDKWGERVTAVVILKTQVDQSAIIEACRAKLPGFKVPKQVLIIKENEMPRTATGKILHRFLRERYGGDGGKACCREDACDAG